MIEAVKQKNADIGIYVEGFRAKGLVPSLRLIKALPLVPNVT
jgi:hypothetical protein